MKACVILVVGGEDSKHSLHNVRALPWSYWRQHGMAKISYETVSSEEIQIKLHTVTTINRECEAPLREVKMNYNSICRSFNGPFFILNYHQLSICYNAVFISADLLWSNEDQTAIEKKRKKEVGELKKVHIDTWSAEFMNLNRYRHMHASHCNNTLTQTVTGNSLLCWTVLPFTVSSFWSVGVRELFTATGVFNSPHEVKMSRKQSTIRVSKQSIISPVLKVTNQQVDWWSCLTWI